MRVRKSASWFTDWAARDAAETSAAIVTRTQRVRAAGERVRAATSLNVIDLKIIGVEADL
jgi:hypothetical protein